MSGEDKKNENLDEELDEKSGTNDNGADDSSNDKGADNGAGDKGNDKGSEGKSAEKTFTQEQVNRMMTKEKNQGRNAVYNELGIDPKDSKKMDALKEFIKSQETAEEAEAKRTAEIDEANAKAALAEAKVELMMAGVKPQFVDDCVTLALSKVDDGNDLTTIVGELKTKYPVWFGENEDGEDEDTKTGQKGTGSSLGAKGNSSGKGGKDEGLGARLAAQRRSSSSKKSSYWNN